MKFFLIFFLSLLLEVFLPWYIILIVPFLVCFMLPRTPFKDFITSFLAVLVLWYAVSLYRDLPNHSILSGKIAMLFNLHSPYVLFLVASLLGGLLAGLAGLSGFYCRDLFRAQRS